MAVFQLTNGFSYFAAKFHLPAAQAKLRLGSEAFKRNRTASTFGLITALPGDPRTFGAAVRAKF